jgi:anti-anti-sigma factor
MDITIDYEDNKAIVKVEGAITSDTANMFHKKLNEAQKDGVERIEIDLTECKIICSTGIGKLLICYKEMNAKGGEVEITKCSIPVYDLFQTIKLDQIIPVNI